MSHRQWLSCLLLFCLLWPAAQAQEARGKVLFILDGSGSMWGRVEGQPKIAIAKEVMTGLIRELPDNVDAGLQVYGHRSKGDCDDIELLAPVGGSDRATLIQRIQEINPKGKTPITRSFQFAAKQLRESEEETTVVLISDGKETCDADPCALAAPQCGQAKAARPAVALGQASPTGQPRSLTVHVHCHPNSIWPGTIHWLWSTTPIGCRH